MSDDITPRDVLELVADIAPGTRVIEREWHVDRRSAVLHSILERQAGPDHAGRAVPLALVATHAVGGLRRRSFAVPVAASVAAVLLAGGAVAAVVGTRGSDGGAASPGQDGGHASSAFTPPGGLSHHAIDDGQYAYQRSRQFDVRADGTAIDPGGDAMHLRDYVAYDGTTTSIRTGSQNGCRVFAGLDHPDFSDPSVEFFAALPTDPAALTSYIRDHVSGSSSSLDEAVFAAIGDALQTNGELASPALRAAMLAVLSRTPGVTLHDDDTDFLGRPAIRADFVDQATRPGHVQAYYFDPTDFRLLAERLADSGAPSTYDGPSPAYSAPRSPATDPAQLSGKGYISLNVATTVLDSLPADAKNCSGDLALSSKGATTGTPTGKTPNHP